MDAHQKVMRADIGRRNFSQLKNVGVAERAEDDGFHLYARFVVAVDALIVEQQTVKTMMQKCITTKAKCRFRTAPIPR
jgi:hypothetical protein